MFKNRRAAVLTVAIVLAGCRTENDGDPLESTALQCQARPLSQYCSGAACPDYEAAVVNTRRHAATERPGQCVALIGTCGGLRHTFTGVGFGGTGLFFDSAGQLVAVEVSTDAVDPKDPCRGSKFYGTVIRCVPDFVERLCSLG